uniref:Globin family profile domain-containing protein n=1 Tax=Wuchereria bancrofti TaxID=6293 RepID=A0AAF5PKJ7_WUCBA
MFLISKIVRGRRLLQELEAETEKKVVQEVTAIEPSAMIFRQSVLATRMEKEKSVDETSQINYQCGAGPSNANMTYTTAQPSSCRKVRQKRDSSLPDGVETDLDFSDHAVLSHIRRSSSMPSVSDPIIGPILKHYDYNLRLNRFQKRFLRFTWHRLQTKNEMFTIRTFLSAISRSETATPRNHAKETVKLIDYAIKNLEVNDKERNDAGSDYDPFLLGKAHGRLRPYGFTGNHWEKLGEIIVDVVLVQEAVRDLPGARQAWVIFTACLVDQLRAGFDESKSGLTPMTAMFSQKYICNTVTSDSANGHHQHTFPSTDTTCHSSACYTMSSIRKANTTFDSGMPQMNERRNYLASMAEHGTSKFHSRRRNSARFVTSRKHSKDQYTSSYRRTYHPFVLSPESTNEQHIL